MEPDKEIGKLLQGFQPACVLMTANELKLFDAIADTPQTAQQVADRLSLAVKGTERLLNALVALGMVSMQDGRYGLDAVWKPYLTSSGAHAMQQWIQLVADQVPLWEQLGTFVRTGTMIKSIMDLLSHDPVKMRGFIDAMHDKALKAPAGIAREIPLDDRRRLLDIGGGPGTYALEWATTYPALHATVFDIPPVLEVAKDYIRRYGLEDRVDTLAGDFTKNDFPAGFDLVLIANVLHMYDAGAAQRLVQKAASALQPGGRLIVQGFCTDAGDTAPLPDVLFSLNIGLLTEGGRAHPVPEMERWMREAGLTGLRHFRIDALPTGVLTGVVPA